LAAAGQRRDGLARIARTITMYIEKKLVFPMPVRRIANTSTPSQSLQPGHHEVHSQNMLPKYDGKAHILREN
jgi:hypothetical protein